MNNSSISELVSAWTEAQAELTKSRANRAHVEDGVKAAAKELEAAEADMGRAEERFHNATIFSPETPEEVSAHVALVAARERVGVAKDRSIAFQQELEKMLSYRGEHEMSLLTGKVNRLYLSAWDAVRDKELESLPKVAFDVFLRAAAAGRLSLQGVSNLYFSQRESSVEELKAVRDQLAKKYGLIYEC